MEDLDGFGSKSKYGCNSSIYWIVVFVSHFQIDLLLHIGEESCGKIQNLVINFEFDIRIHRIDGCYNLKVNFFHHEKVSFVISHCKKKPSLLWIGWKFVNLTNFSFL
jgi:hypothetical protein